MPNIEQVIVPGRFYSVRMVDGEELRVWFDPIVPQSAWLTCKTLGSTAAMFLRSANISRISEIDA